MKLEFKRKNTKLIVIVTVVAVLLACTLLLFIDTSPHDNFTLTVFFTGDLHGDVSRLAKYYTVIQQGRKQGNVLLLDCGDLYYQGANQAKGGVPESLLLSYMKYDAMVLGNNEFKIAENTPAACNAQIKKLAGQASFSLLCANIKMDGQYLEGIKPYVIVNKGGLKIAVVGLTTNQITNKEVKDKTLLDPAQTLSNLQEELLGKADITIVLSHCEENQNKDFRDVAAVVAGHIHEPTITPQIGYNGIPIVRAGGKDRGNLGKLTLHLVEDETGWSVDHYDFELCDVSNVLPNKKLQGMATQLGY